MRRAVKSVISKCIICKRFNAQKMKADVAHLPLNRVRDARVFEIVGVDFVGSLFLRGQERPGFVYIRVRCIGPYI